MPPEEDMTTTRPKPPASLFDAPVGDAGVGTIAMHGSAEVIDHYRGAAARQLERVQASEAAAGAGDDHHLPGEVDHGHSSPKVSAGLIRRIAHPPRRDSGRVRREMRSSSVG